MSNEQEIRAAINARTVTAGDDLGVYVAAVYVDGVKVDNVEAINVAEGWARQLQPSLVTEESDEIPATILRGQITYDVSM